MLQHRRLPPDVCLWICQQGKRRSNDQESRFGLRLQRMCGNGLFELRTLMGKQIRIGTRGSQLALWQARWVQSRILSLKPDAIVELTAIKTVGDKILDVPLSKVGGKGLFVKEIEEAILDGRVDLAVHSMKDMPSELPEGLVIGAVPERELPVDVLFSRKNHTLSELPEGARIGTSSLRRAAQLLAHRPDVHIVPLRGNLDTRIRKLDTEDLDAIVLAAAGVRRLGLQDRITEYLNVHLMVPAVGQGALCIESRHGDDALQPILSAMENPETRTVVTAERAFLARLEGGCQVPIAGHGILEEDRLQVTGLVADLDGKTVIRESLDGPPEDAEKIGTALADMLLDRGARKILDKLYGTESEP